MDTRNEYRAVSRIYPDGELWFVQWRPWWWPFWIELEEAWDITDAKAKAELHSNPPYRVVRIATFGRLP